MYDFAILGYLYVNILFMSSSPKDRLASLADHPALKDISLTFLEAPRRSIEINVPVMLDSGEEILVKGFRVQYDDTLGPTKGGLRIHQHADYNEVVELAFLMALKTSLVGLPYGGAKGAIQIDPKQYSSAELERVMRAFVHELAPFIGEDVDIPAPDVNTNADTMRIMLDEYEKTIGKKSPATFTGKHIDDGGTLGREEATGQGGFYVLEAFMKNREPRDIRVAIQGFGNVGMHLARLLFDAGYKVIAVSDSSSGVYADSGLNIPALIEWKAAHNRFADYGEAERISNDDVLTLACDVLAPSALGGVITNDNAHDVKASYILEMANGPVTPEADAKLNKRGITVIPDILANAGGVIVSYFEWLQNKQGERWTQERVNEDLKAQLLDTIARITPYLDEATSLRNASYIEAIKRIAGTRVS